MCACGILRREILYAVRSLPEKRRVNEFHRAHSELSFVGRWAIHLLWKGKGRVTGRYRKVWFRISGEKSRGLIANFFY